MRRGEIWWVNLDPTIGAEIKKKRPAVIISSDAVGKLPLKIVVPITEWKDGYADAPWMIRIKPDSANQLKKESAADAFQVRSVAVERLASRLGLVNSRTLAEIIQAVGLVISDI